MSSPTTTPAAGGLPHLAYRPDIDGLRAIAVLSVVAYHAFPSLLRGGFVGVDIFFVISGYLISKILFGGLERNGRVDLREFYSRRVRRIFPALSVVLLATLAAGWLLLTAGDYRQLGKHVIGGAGFVANLVLWREAGYFDAAAELKPLLHLWSLGVEEQFYFFWPIALWAGFRARLDTRLLLAATIAASFALNLWLAHADPVADFFSPLPRFWELGIGGLLAHLSMRDGTHLATGLARRMRLPEARVSDAVSISGRGCIVVSVYLVHRGLAFPGAWAALPVAGAALLIAAGPDAWVNRWLLSHRAMVWVGVISYPLYLWHWPLFSFARIAAPGMLTPAVMVLLVAVSIGLAALTYYGVERPIRTGLRWRPPLVLAGTMATVALCGCITWATQGFAGRYQDDIAAYANFKYEFLQDARGNRCWLNAEAAPDGFAKDCIDAPASPSQPRMVVWGDSHAARLFPGIRKATEGRFALAQFTRDACPPFLQMPDYANCEQGNAYVLARIREMRASTVVLFAYWKVQWAARPDAEAALGRTIDALRDAGVQSIVVVGPAPRWSTPLPNNLVQLWRTQQPAHLPARTMYGLEPGSAALDRTLGAYVRARGDAIYFSPYAALCNAEGCLTRTGSSADTLTSWDYGHFTTSGATYVARALGRQTDDFGDFR
jgi:peptidoglycan/LPS O-acetylase OafA/YrhL